MTELAAAFAAPFLVSLTLTAVLTRLAPRLGLVDQPGERKVHQQPTPKGGGIAVYLALLAALPFATGLPGLLAFGGLVAVLGLADDLRPLPWPFRLSVQFLLAATAVVARGPEVGLPLGALAVVGVVGLLNAFNLLDNMDALSGGTAWLAAATLALADAKVAPVCLALMGALSGFLWFNRPPARIFLGDTGSTLLGFVLALVGLEVAFGEGAAPWSSAVPLCAFAVPLYDLTTVVLLRLSQGRSPFHADKQHLSHRLAARGLSNPMAVGVIHLLGVASGLSALLAAGATGWGTAGLATGQLAAWWAALAWLEFGRRR